MQRKVLLLLLLAACRSSAPPLGTPEELVRALCERFAWETEEDAVASGKALLEQPPDVLEQYLAEPLVRLHIADRECATASQAVCRLDWDPMWASQDPVGASDVTVSQSADSIVMVQFTYPTGTHVRLEYVMVEASEGWRIADIRAPAEWSLVEILSRSY